MKVILKGSGEVTLTQQNYLASGGQADVYIKDGLAYKIYKDPACCLPADKLHTLKEIKDSHVIKPEALLLNTSKKPIGYAMKSVNSGTYNLSQIFTKGFRNRRDVTPKMVVDLVSKFKEHICNVHKEGILIVDLNEFNIKVLDNHTDLFMFDVDSYQTKDYPATVILPSIRDYSVSPSQFSTLSDWFSYGILTFQMFVGIHPYKGTHKHSEAKIHDKDLRLKYRMENHISVFRSNEVSVPACCYPLDNIPDGFRAWLRAVLEEGKRLPPPNPDQPLQAVLQQTPVTPVGVSTTQIKIEKIYSLEGNLISYEDDGKDVVTLVRTPTGEAVVSFNEKYFTTLLDVPSNTLVGINSKTGRVFGLYVLNGTMRLIDFSSKTTSILGKADSLVKSSPGLFHIKSGENIFELDFIDNTNTFSVLATRSVANVLDKASTLFEGCCIQNVLGSIFVSIFPRAKVGYQIRVPELDKCKIMSAKASNGTMMVCGAVNGKYNRYILRFNDNYREYDIRVVEDVVPMDVNFITLDSKVTVSLTEDGHLEAFRSIKGSSGIKVSDLPPHLDNSIRLIKVKGKATFAYEDGLYKVETQ